MATDTQARRHAYEAVGRYLDWARDGIDATKRDLLHVDAGDFRDHEIASLVVSSEWQPNCYDVLLKLAEDYLLKRLALPGPLAAFVIKAMNGQCRRPAARGPSGDANAARDAVITEAVAIALNMDRSLRPYRNHASVGGSACDLVSESLASCGIHIGYDGVKHIWKQAKNAFILANKPVRRRSAPPACPCRARKRDARRAGAAGCVAPTPI